MGAITVGIDASNIRAGGGITHLSQLLKAVPPEDFGIKRIYVWGGIRTLDRLPENRWLHKRHVPHLDRSLPFRMAWQQVGLPKELRKANCDALFSPGGTLPLYLPVPAIVMSQNLLPFEPVEAARFGSIFNLMRLKMMLLRKSQGGSMLRADGIIFLTRYARQTVLSKLKRKPRNIEIIPHGIEERFFSKPKSASQLEQFGTNWPFRLLYVSIVDVYKHQGRVAQAVASLREKGFPVEIDFVGPAYPPALVRFEKTIKSLDPAGEFLHYRGAVAFKELHTAYSMADAFVFASSCENLPNILLEAMAAGLPIACSSRGPMPEVLGEAGCYFDPEKVEEIEGALAGLIENSTLRDRLSLAAHQRAQAFSWGRCAAETFSFIVSCLRTSSTVGGQN